MKNFTPLEILAILLSMLLDFPLEMATKTILERKTSKATGILKASVHPILVQIMALPIIPTLLVAIIQVEPILATIIQAGPLSLHVSFVKREVTLQDNVTKQRTSSSLRQPQLQIRPQQETQTHLRGC